MGFPAWRTAIPGNRVELGATESPKDRLGGGADDGAGVTEGRSLFGGLLRLFRKAEPPCEGGLTLRVGSLTITGNFRDNNEDGLFADAANRFWLVADGMGGQSAGERASQLALELIPKKLELIDFEAGGPDDAVRVIDEAIQQANFEIMALGELDAKFHNMGTTVTFIVRVGSRVFVGGVGDSRIYRWRDDVIEQITKDHSLVQALIDAGTLTPEEALHHRYRNVLYRYLGTKEGSSATNPAQLDLKRGDRFLMCTDGVTGGINDEKIAEILAGATDPQAAAESVVRAAEAGGSKDNITSLVIFVE